MSKNKKNQLVVIISVATLLLISIIAFIFINKSDSNISKKFKNKIGLSVASVDGNKISFNDLEIRTLASKNFFEKQNFEKAGVRIDFTTPEGKKRLKVLERKVLNNLIEGKAIENIAHSKGILVSDAEINMAFKRAISGSDPKFVKKRLELYNFTEEEFTKYIVQRELYIKKVEDYYIKNSEIDQDALMKIKKAKEELKSGVNFSEVAKKYSEGITASSGGELGFFQRNQLDPELEKKAFSMKKGEVSDIIETISGFHIISVDDILNNDSGKVMMVSVNEIFVAKRKDFMHFFENAIKNMDIEINSSDYEWDTSKNEAIFKDASLREFEKELIK